MCQSKIYSYKRTKIHSTGIHYKFTTFLKICHILKSSNLIGPSIQLPFKKLVKGKFFLKKEIFTVIKGNFAQFLTPSPPPRHNSSQKVRLP
jgi:hypothetical protein